MSVSNVRRYALTDLTADEVRMIGQGRYKLSGRRAFCIILIVAWFFLIAVSINNVFPTRWAAAQTLVPIILIVAGFTVVYFLYVRPFKRAAEDFLKAHKTTGEGE